MITTQPSSPSAGLLAMVGVYFSHRIRHYFSDNPTTKNIPPYPSYPTPLEPSLLSPRGTKSSDAKARYLPSRARNWFSKAAAFLTPFHMTGTNALPAEHTRNLLPQQWGIRGAQK